MRHYIKPAHMPPTMGIEGRIAVWLLLDRLHAGQGWFCAFWTFAVIGVVLFVYRAWTERGADPKYEDSTQAILDVVRRMVAKR